MSGEGGCWGGAGWVSGHAELGRLWVPSRHVMDFAGGWEARCYPLLYCLHGPPYSVQRTFQLPSVPSLGSGANQRPRPPSTSLPTSSIVARPFHTLRRLPPGWATLQTLLNSSLPLPRPNVRLLFLPSLHRCTPHADCRLSPESSIGSTARLLNCTSR